MTTAFVESCVETAADSAGAAERSARGRPHFAKLLRLLKDKKNILISSHRFPDPDALASGWALCLLLSAKIPGATVGFSIKGLLGGGANQAFIRHSRLKLVPWDDDLSGYDAIILTDVRPDLSYSPLPPGVMPLGVIDHHRTRRKPRTPFCDIRTDVGATTSIIFSYFMEVEQPISPDLAATMLYAIESDLAGAAGQPGDLDNVALSSLTLLADTRTLYQMRYVDQNQGYYAAFYVGLANAMVYGDALISHLDTIDSPERPAMLADFLLRYDGMQWAMVTAVYEGRLVVSLRTRGGKLPAADMIRRVLRSDGEGGGHRTKAGGYTVLASPSAAETERKRALLRRRYLRALHLSPAAGKHLVPKKGDMTIF